MTWTHFLKSVAVVLALGLVVPSAILVAPSRVQALTVFDPANWVQNQLSAVKGVLTEINTATAAAAAVAQQVNTYVLQPLAFVMSVGLLKALTAGVISFVIGKSNGTGQPQFVQDLQGSLQRVGDIKAQAFFIQFGRNSNSPFASSISSSLKTSYLQNTSMAGFWSKYRSTLGLASPNVNAFLAGNWSQGGTRAWMALTTQPENNPYMLKQATESQLNSVVADAQATRQKVLDWGQGFMSWCPTGSAPAPDAASATQSDSCLDADGNPVPAATPGSTIKATLDKALGAVQDKVVQIGSMAKEVNGIMGNLAQVFQTINLAQAILGGPGSGGLAGFGSVSSNGASAYAIYNRNDLFGVNATTVNQSTVAIQNDLATQMARRINEYESAWNTIATTITSATDSLTSLVRACPGFESTVQDAMTNEIAPLNARVSASRTVIADARSFIAKVQSAQNQGGSGSSTAYQNDLNTLQTMSPTAQDLSVAQMDAMPGSGATQSGANSLIVSGGSIVDQMNLVKTNVMAMQVACTPRDSAGG